MTTFSVVALANLGADFDTAGAQVAGKINLVAATTAVSGKVRLASAGDIASGTAGAVVDAANLKLQLASILGNYQGAWNAATNTPQLLSGQGTKGYLYKVSTAGLSVATTASAAITAAAVIPVASATGIVPGQLLAASGVTGTVTVVSISGLNVTVSANVTIASGAAVTFSTYLDGAGPFYAGDLVEFDGTSWDKSNGSGETSVNVTDAFGNHLYFAAP